MIAAWRDASRTQKGKEEEINKTERPFKINDINEPWVDWMTDSNLCTLIYQSKERKTKMKLLPHYLAHRVINSIV